MTAPARRALVCLFAASGGLVAFPRPEDDASVEPLRYDQVQFKAAHNSIDREESLAAQLDGSPESPSAGNCRGLELDLVLDPARVDAAGGWVFGVQHGGAFRPDTPRLARCLAEIRAWADSHPGHDPVTIHLDLKREATAGDDGVFAREIDAALAKGLGKDHIFTPALLQRGAPTLLEGARKHGWPALRDLRGKFVLVFSGEDNDEAVARRRRAYVRSEPAERLAFVDLDQRAAGSAGADECDIESPYYSEGSRVFVNIQLGRKDWERLARGARARGFVTREWKANDEEAWRKALEAGVNILSTDRIRGSAWAMVGRGPFRNVMGPTPRRD
jgi:glycerophosphoryl diester phosphodiesterase